MATDSDVGDASATPVLSNEFVDWANSLFDGDDHAVIILGVSRLDSMLEQVLRRTFVEDVPAVQKLLKIEGPLGAFSARIDACCAMGDVSPQLAAELHRLRKIRNAAAHTWKPVSLVQQPFRDQVTNLKLMKQPGFDKLSNTRTAFVHILAQLVYHFEDYAANRKHAKPGPPSAVDLALMDEAELRSIVNNRRLVLDRTRYDMTKPNNYGPMNDSHGQ